MKAALCLYYKFHCLISRPTHSQFLLTSRPSYTSPFTAQGLSTGLFQHPQHTQQCDTEKPGRGCCFDLTPLLWARGEDGRGLKSKTFTPITKTLGFSRAAMLIPSLSHGSVSKFPKIRIGKQYAFFFLAIYSIFCPEHWNYSLPITNLLLYLFNTYTTLAVNLRDSKKRCANSSPRGET